jgi:hypothetical protein
MSSAGLLLKLDRLFFKKLGIAYQPGSILGEAHARRCIRVPSRLLAPKLEDADARLFGRGAAVDFRALMRVTAGWPYTRSSSR